MWKRFIRAIKSMFGGVVNSMEDPKLILEQNIRELNDQVPKMNENIATVKANVMMLQKDLNKHEKQITELTSKIKSALQADREDIAENYAVQLQKAKEQLEHIKEQLTYAERGYEKALQVKKNFMREKDKKIREAREALRAHERAQWQSKIADTLEQFEVGGLDQTHDEMINRINEDSAKNEARIEMALDSMDTDAMQIEMDAEKIRAKELLNQFKLEMDGGAGSAQQTSETEEESAESTSAGKTLGKQKTS